MGAMDANYTSKIPAVMVSHTIKKLLQPIVCNMNPDSNSNIDTSSNSNENYCSNNPIIHNANTNFNNPLNTVLVSLSFDNAPSTNTANTINSSFIVQYTPILLESLIPLVVVVLLIVSITNIEYNTIIIIRNLMLILLFILTRLSTLRTSSISDSYNHQGNNIYIYNFLVSINIIINFRN